MAGRTCPVCGSSVKLENLERHVAKVHPGTKISVALSEEERRAIRTRRRTRRTGVRPGRSAVALGLTLALALAGVVIAWPYLSSAPAGSSGAGGPMHIHPHIQITLDGQDRPLPTNIGIDPGLWNDHSLDQYSSMGPMAPLHTHESSGQIHVESTVTRDFTLGEFFRVWGQPLSATRVWDHPAETGHGLWMVVDGQRTAVAGGLVLRDQMRIEIVCGPL